MENYRQEQSDGTDDNGNEADGEVPEDFNIYDIV